jgi:hypothetical protein
MLDSPQASPYCEGMEIHLEQSQEAKLNELAIKTGRGTDELVQEAVHRLLAPSQA